VTLLTLLVGCDPPAQIYPVGACRMGERFADVAVEVTCASGGEPLTSDLAWAADTRAGGTQGEGWDGTGFYATGLSVVRGVSGAWAVEATECGACAAWEVTVDGLPDL
jgi:hypothetical protein